MVKYFLVGLFLVLRLATLGQINQKTKTEFGLGISVLSSYTDIGGSKSSGEGLVDFRLSDLRPGINGFYKYNFTPSFSVKTGGKLGVFSNSDKNSRNVARGFAVNIPFLEVTAVGQFFIIKEKEPYFYRSNVRKGRTWSKNVAPAVYLQGGVGVGLAIPIKNEKMANSNASGIKNGVSIVPVFPLGLGITYPVGVDVRLYLDVNYAFTLSDYMDGYNNPYYSDSKDMYFALNIGLVYQFGNKMYEWKKTKIKTR